MGVDVVCTPPPEKKDDNRDEFLSLPHNVSRFRRRRAQRLFSLIVRRCNNDLISVYCVI